MVYGEDIYDSYGRYLIFKGGDIYKDVTTIAMWEVNLSITR